MSTNGNKTINYALIAASVIGVLAIAGLIVAMLMTDPNEGAREVTAALAAIAGTVVGGLIFLLKKDTPPEVVETKSEKTLDPPA